MPDAQTSRASRGTARVEVEYCVARKYKRIAFKDNIVQNKSSPAVMTIQKIGEAI